MAVTSKNPLRASSDDGQSVWLDYIRRSLIMRGELRRLIEDDGLRGVTSNTAIFENAVAGVMIFAAGGDPAGLDITGSETEERRRA